VYPTDAVELCRVGVVSLLLAVEMLCVPVLTCWCVCVDVWRLNIQISCKRVTQLSDDVVDWAFQLTKSNMQLM